MPTKKLTLKQIEQLEKNNITWGFIASRPCQFATTFNEILKQLPSLEETKKYKFLDVGAGTGNMMDIATAVGHLNNKPIVANGIEHNPKLVKIRNYSIKPFADLVGIDALRFKDYDYYDIIYYYRPIRNEQLMKQLEQKIDNEAKKGAIIIANYKIFDSENEIKNNNKFKILTRSNYFVYQKLTK